MQRSWLKRSVYDLSRIAVRCVGWVLCRLTYLGQEHFPKEGAALVCSNHQSYLDPMLMGGMCDRRLNYLARESLFRSKLFSGLIRFYDAIPVRRDGMSITGLKETLRRLKNKEMVVVFPEGTRTPDGSIQTMKPGFCILARRAKVPLVPVAIDGSYDTWPKGRKFPFPARMCLVAGPPISVEEIETVDDETLVKMLDERIQECFRLARQQNGREVIVVSSSKDSVATQDQAMQLDGDVSPNQTSASNREVQA